mgnify:CR=1 FL=1
MNSKNFVVIYRIYYRPLSSYLNPKFHMTPTSKDETKVLRVEVDRPIFYTLKDSNGTMNNDLSLIGKAQMIL